jgi:hypothetical protein
MPQKHERELVTLENHPILVVIVAFFLFDCGTGVADDVPVYNLRPSCQAETVSAASDRSCLNDERAARDVLVKQWSQFTERDRANCRQLQEAGGAPSYVELLTCPQLAVSADKLPQR